MNEFLRGIVEQIAKLHSYIMKLNDQFETNFTDKQLHFLIIGILGMGLIFLIYPLFKWLAKRKHVMVITWIYVFTLVLVLTFAIEIGQGWTKTGVMEFGDIMFGVFGFIMFFVIFSCIRGIYHVIRKLIQNSKARKMKQEETQTYAGEGQEFPVMEAPVQDYVTQNSAISTSNSNSNSETNYVYYKEE